MEWHFDGELEKSYLFDAKLIMRAGFTGQVVFCLGHMSMPSFLYLQDVWMKVLVVIKAD